MSRNRCRSSGQWDCWFPLIMLGLAFSAEDMVGRRGGGDVGEGGEGGWGGSRPRFLHGPWSPNPSQTIWKKNILEKEHPGGYMKEKTWLCHEEAQVELYCWGHTVDKVAPPRLTQPRSSLILSTYLSIKY